LVVKKSLTVIDPKISKLRNLIKKIRSSNITIQNLKEACSFSRIEYLKPILDVPTRWSSTSYMLQRALYLKKGLTSFTAKGGKFFDDELSVFNLKKNEWEEIEAILNFISIFEPVTKEAQGDKYITISTIIPYFNLLLDTLEEYSQTKKDKIIKKSAQTAFEFLNKYYDKSNDTTYVIALILFPRFKLEYYKSDTSKTAVKPNDMKKVISEEYKKYIKKYHFSDNQGTQTQFDNQETFQEKSIFSFKRARVDESVTELGKYL